MRDDREQLDLFGRSPSSPLLKRIRELDMKMERAITDGKYALARQLAREQERLLGNLMERE
ncbi:hypothetical protein AMJ82_02190 [candidate division TA06 bacterium SM23_40]|uniref:UVR domain-containing protein n=1 Tax=candidate division TA06 bacterium SM23_40 TaxID=1703774 RepID=A0A0S8GD93_UNCT6|nr:MAG: hypothetical protein AMJ82_02190 [candidate division TA06 bacterium SM23_40]